jgi:DNA-binding transcriptional regulator YiaG
MVLTTALILAFSPQEKEQRLNASGFANDRPANPVADISKEAGNRFSLSWGRVALLGIAQRTVRVIFNGNQGNLKRVNALKTSVKSLGDWLKVKRQERNLTPGHVAAKMGIAAAVVYSWECDEVRPSNGQLARLTELLGFKITDVL